jgi:hypothetical protein
MIPPERVGRHERVIRSLSASGYLGSEIQARTLRDLKTERTIAEDGSAQRIDYSSATS